MKNIFMTFVFILLISQGINAKDLNGYGSWNWGKPLEECLIENTNIKIVEESNEMSVYYEGHLELLEKYNISSRIFIFQNRKLVSVEIIIPCAEENSIASIRESLVNEMGPAFTERAIKNDFVLGFTADTLNLEWSFPRTILSAIMISFKERSIPPITRIIFTFSEYFRNVDLGDKKDKIRIDENGDGF